MFRFGWFIHIYTIKYKNYSICKEIGRSHYTIKCKNYSIYKEIGRSHYSETKALKINIEEKKNDFNV
jgi:hypothetical protein